METENSRRWFKPQRKLFHMDNNQMRDQVGLLTEHCHLTDTPDTRSCWEQTQIIGGSVNRVGKHPLIYGGNVFP